MNEQGNVPTGESVDITAAFLDDLKASKTDEQRIADGLQIVANELHDLGKILLRVEARLAGIEAKMGNDTPVPGGKE